LTDTELHELHELIALFPCMTLVRVGQQVQVAFAYKNGMRGVMHPRAALDLLREVKHETT
jgi:hypothetical protein